MKISPMVRFKNVKDEHVEYFKTLMQGEDTKNLSIDKKRRLLLDEFPDLRISRSTVHKIVALAVATHCLVKEAAQV